MRGGEGEGFKERRGAPRPGSPAIVAGLLSTASSGRDPTARTPAPAAPRAALRAPEAHKLPLAPGPHRPLPTAVIVPARLLPPRRRAPGSGLSGSRAPASEGAAAPGY